MHYVFNLRKFCKFFTALRPRLARFFSVFYFAVRDTQPTFCCGWAGTSRAVKPTHIFAALCGGTALLLCSFGVCLTPWAVDLAAGSI